MKLFTLNFLTCAVKSCRNTNACFPLHIKDAELLQSELEFNLLFWQNVQSRIEWGAMKDILAEVGLRLPDAVTERLNAAATQPEQPMEGVEATTPGVDLPPLHEFPELDEDTLRKLHTMLLETQVQEGFLVCGNCGHQYAVKEGIPNFLLPPHLV